MFGLSLRGASCRCKLPSDRLFAASEMNMPAIANIPMNARNIKVNICPPCAGTRTSLRLSSGYHRACYSDAPFLTRGNSCDTGIMPRGYFITFEGLDGSGKTTQLRRLAASLTASGHSVVTLRQPGSTALGDRLRAVLLDSRSESALGPIHPLAEMALMFADRAQAIAEVISPALDAGSIILCDRFTDSSEAYQGAGRELGSQRILAMHSAVCNNLQPDLTLLLLPPLEASLARARRRNHRDAVAKTSVKSQGADENRFERESDDFYARIHAAYQQIAAREPDRVLTIANDASGDNSIDAIELRIRALVSTRIPAPASPAGAANLVTGAL
jgi:dTMP kinase